MEKLVIATRGSRLALWQANHVKDSLEAVHPGLAVELNIIKTKGDIILDVPLAKVGGTSRKLRKRSFPARRTSPCTA